MVAELRQTVWPSQRQTLRISTVIVFALLAMVVIIAVIDGGLGNAMDALYRR